MNIQDVINNLEAQLDALEDMDSIPDEKKSDVIHTLNEAIDKCVAISDGGYGFEDEDRDDYYNEDDE